MSDKNVRTQGSDETFRDGMGHAPTINRVFSGEYPDYFVDLAQLDGGMLYRRVPSFFLSLLRITSVEYP